MIPATVDYVVDTSRSTTLGIGKVCIHTVEHVLAAVKALNIDNLIIEVSNIEPPVASGGSKEFIAMLENAEVVEQAAKTQIIHLKDPVYHSDGDIHIVALPSDHYRISYTLSYPNNPVLKSQYQSFAIDEETFKKEIAPCRTFSLYEEVSYLMDRGLIKGGSLDNAVIIKGDVVFSKEGLHFKDEMVRHKILDVVGDLLLVGFDFRAHVIAIRSGHASNYAFAKKIRNAIMKEISQ
jgi:UDP-3-O-[3-hydroxymyristoyl] N-acetylglucosamine deacetylase